ncbi:hypothetical protein U0070_009241 [Myodes glareolus]|uniref:Uncharacterized protein n=1 Tax=Myodes glareolus TaxID=447135 RepID=A0AAW0IR96_MYOGA
MKGTQAKRVNSQEKTGIMDEAVHGSKTMFRFEVHATLLSSTAMTFCSVDPRHLARSQGQRGQDGGNAYMHEERSGEGITDCAERRK